MPFADETIPKALIVNRLRLLNWPTGAAMPSTKVWGSWTRDEYSAIALAAFTLEANTRLRFEEIEEDGGEYHLVLRTITK